MRRTLPLLAALGTSGCERPCVDMCQSLDRWVKECGTTWETEFAEEGWANVEQCVKELDDPSRAELRECRQLRHEYDARECY